VTALDELVELVRPPSHARQEIDWTTVETSVGTRLPDDYKGIIENYGPGTFGKFLHVYQPITPFLTIELAHQSRRSEEILGDLRAQGTEVIPFAPGELMAMAGTDNGDTLYWIKRPLDEPASWAITGNEARNHVWPEFDGGIAAFLYAVMSRELRFPIFPADFPGRRTPAFTTYGPPDKRGIAGLRAQGLYRDL
jgi:hypothetical protein